MIGGTPLDERHDVIIPAWNEADTIVPIIDVLARHDYIKTIIVGIDGKTTDDTFANVASLAAYVSACNSYLVVIGAPCHGKGQVVQHALAMTDRMALQPSARVLLCDADITGLSGDHVTELIAPNEGMVIGIADIPPNLPDFAVRAWPWVGGQRAVPRSLLEKANVHGYLMETQLNQAAAKAGIPVKHAYLSGLKSRFNMTPRRLE